MRDKPTRTSKYFDRFAHQFDFIFQINGFAFFVGILLHLSYLDVLIYNLIISSNYDLIELNESKSHTAGETRSGNPMEEMMGANQPDGRSFGTAST